MAVTLPKLLALLVALGYAVAAGVIEREWGAGLLVFAICLFPLSLIWLPEKWVTVWPGRKKTILYNDADRGGMGGATYRDSPPALVVFMGWFFLVGLPAVLLITWHPW